MKSFYPILVLFISTIIFVSCNQSNQPENNDKAMKSDSITNPLLEEFNTPFHVAPFDKIKVEHYIPAIKAAIEAQNQEIQAIITNPEAPNFENTLVAFDNSGELLSRVSGVFDNLSSSMLTDEMKAITEEIIGLISNHSSSIYLNEKLFSRIKTVYDADQSSLNKEQHALLEKVYKKFVRGGTNLSGEQKDRFKAITEKLAKLTNTFGQNVLEETNAYQLVIDKVEDLSGLPESVIAAAAETGTELNMEGKWVFTLQKPSMIPFLQYADNRDLRKNIFTAYINRANNNNEFDNKSIIQEIIKLRQEKAKILGFNNNAEFILAENMAKTPDAVFELLNKLMPPALEMAKKEAGELQAIIDKEGSNFKLEPWDWWYYAEKLRKEKYNLDEEQLRPYFKLENVKQGAFDVANKLYGISFKENKDIPVYNEETTAYEVLDTDGSHIGILYMDFFPRATKRGGAWMNAFRKQSHRNGKDITPVISVVCNFSKPTGNKPSLLSFDEVLTLFHEFGHALHGLLSDNTYNMISGTSVVRDFVELPSQIMENWAAEPEVLKMYAKHYETGESIPDELIEKIQNSGSFNQGFATTEYLAAALLDMYWHTNTDTENIDVLKFEKQTLDKIGLIPEIVVRYRSTYFSHIFSGGYSAGYYSYVWAEVLDADAFAAFKEKGIFNKELAAKFRNTILSKGGSENAMDMFKEFRGREPEIKALLERKGFN